MRRRWSDRREISRLNSYMTLSGRYNELILWRRPRPLSTGRSTSGSSTDITLQATSIHWLLIRALSLSPHTVRVFSVYGSDLWNNLPPTNGLSCWLQTSAKENISSKPRFISNFSSFRQCSAPSILHLTYSFIHNHSHLFTYSFVHVSVNITNDVMHPWSFIYIQLYSPQGST